MRSAFLSAFLAGALLALPAAAQETPAPPREGILSLLPGNASSEHTITLGGETLRYRAEAGTLDLLGGDAKPTAAVFHTAYTLETGENGAQRPITFVFNGGPGAASAYLHLGAIGPRVVATAEDGAFLPPPQRMVDNPDTWLPFTDLVFVDPVGTGWSRAAPGTEEKSFWGVSQDASAMGAFIRLFLQKSGRTASPLYLAGESYGGFRAALLAKTLQEDIGIAPSGIVLISPALELSMVFGRDWGPLRPALELPPMVASRLAREGVTGDAFAKGVAEAEAYAMGPYMAALAQGREAGGRLASARVAELTGLPRDLVERHFARVPTRVFAREAARATGEVLSMYDGGLGAPDPQPQSAWGGGPDSVLDRSVPVLTSAFVDYAARELGFRTPVSFRLLNGAVSGAWDYGFAEGRQGYAGVMDDLQEARALNPALRVLITHGFTDLVTPYTTSRFLVDQLPPLEGAEPIGLRTYPGGHMMYLQADARAALTRDVREVYGE